MNNEQLAMNNALRWDKSKAENIKIPKKYELEKAMSVADKLYWAKYHSWECFKEMKRVGTTDPLNNYSTTSHIEKAETYLNTAGYSIYNASRIVRGWLKGWLNNE